VTVVLELLRSVALDPAIASILAVLLGAVAVRLFQSAVDRRTRGALRAWSSFVLAAVAAAGLVAVAIAKLNLKTLAQRLGTLGIWVLSGPIVAGVSEKAWRCLRSLWRRSSPTLETYEIHKLANRVEPTDFRLERYRTEYVRRPSNQAIEDCLDAGDWVLITGKPLAGKTRAAYEALRNLTGRLLISPRPDGLSSLASVKPSPRGVLLFLDNLQRFAGTDLEHAVDEFLARCGNLVVIATCRSGDELEEVRDRLLSLYRRLHLVELEDITRDEGMALARETGGSLDLFDGTPGSIILDLEGMRQRYRKAGEEGRAVLRTLKVLAAGGLYRNSESSVRNLCAAIFGVKGERFHWDEILISLVRNGLIRRENDSGSISIGHETYLDFCVDDYDPGKDLVSLKDWCVNQKDPFTLSLVGNSLSRKEQFALAMECFQEALALDAGNAFIHNGYGYILQMASDAEKARGKYEDAERLCNEALTQHRQATALRPRKPTERYLIGLALSRLGHIKQLEGDSTGAAELYNQAADELSRAVEARPDLPRTYGALSAVFDKLGQRDKAELAIDKALELEPSSPLFHAQRGFILASVGRRSEAEAEYREALRINPNHPGALNNLGHLLNQEKRHPEAIRMYREAVRVSPGSLVARTNLGRALVSGAMTKEGVKEAIKEYRSVLAVNPLYAEARTALGFALGKLGDYDGAEREYRRVIAVRPGLAEAHGNRGWALGKLGRREDALHEFETARKLAPKDADVGIGLAMALEKLEEYDTAEELYETLYGEHPGDEKLLKTYLYFLTVRRKDRKDKVVEDFDRVTATRGSDVAGQGVALEALVTRIYLLLKVGRTEDARSDAERLARNHPSNPQVLLVVATVMEAVGDKERGRGNSLESNRLYVEAER
jgi:tetratricopeptide (TPR) repeat protein/uncharacterized membrane protein YgdD (TMEM256/DUF423 family)